FVDVDAPAGTVEERALVKAFEDGDPSTIKVFMIPAFAGGGRIGESFIYADRSSVRNVVIEDRAGMRPVRRLSGRGGRRWRSVRGRIGRVGRGRRCRCSRRGRCRRRKGRGFGR